LESTPPLDHWRVTGRPGYLAAVTVDGIDDLRGLQAAGAAVAEALRTMGEAVAPGVRPMELDEVGASVLRRHGAISAPAKAYGFPATTCISVNEALAHGIPGRRRLREGDLVNIDVSAEVGGYWADTGASFGVGRVRPRLDRLLRSTRRARDEAVATARAGQPLSAIGRAVERRARTDGFHVVRNLCGHGVGRFIHEAPEVPNVYDRRNRARLWEGLVLAIEPFLTTGATHVEQCSDGWTLRTPDGSRGAQYEHTVVVTQGAPLILTA
jgi:methionyl aminopeptidase